MILLCCAPLGPGCAGMRLTPPILDALDCAKLIPPSYRRPVPPPPLPAADASAGAVLVGLDGAITALDQANGRTADLASIADACQARQRAVLEALDPPPWWERLARAARDHRGGN